MLTHLSRCVGLSTYQILPDLLFACRKCDHVIAPSDLELDPGDTWVITSDGSLAYVYDEPEEIAGGLSGAFEAVNQGADLVLETLALSASERAAVNLAVTAILTCLERPGSTLADVTRNCHEASVSEVRSRYGW